MKITNIKDIKNIRKFTGICEFSNGSKYWYKNGRIHREDGPAVEYSYGVKMWYKNGKVHKEDGPAIEYANDYKEWWLNGKKYTRENYHKELYKIGKISEEELFLELL